MAIEKEKSFIALKAIILVMSTFLLIAAGFLTFWPFGTDSDNKVISIFPQIISLIALVEFCLGPVILKLVVFPGVNKETKTSEVEKKFIKSILLLGMMEGAVFIGMLAIFLARMNMVTPPAWIYLNYIYIPAFLFAGYKCWPRPEKKYVETFASDLLENVVEEND